jgi:outer membrane protein assembly factor BamA
VFIEVEEQPLLGISYGVRYDNEEKIEGVGELNVYNILGRGRHGLFYYRQNNREKDFRFSMKEPYLLGKKFNTLYSFYYTKEAKFSFVTNEIGFSVQQEINLPFNFSLSYLYSYNRIHTYELKPIGPSVFDILLYLSELSSFLVRDTRNDKLDSQQGSFFSLSFTYSPESLGSDLTYISFFGQYSLYKSLLPGVVWASNYRIGIADAFEQVLIPSKRFYAGGGNSIRGFKLDMVGPIDPFFQTPDGGEALLVVNQELRFPIYKWLKGVAFYDAGNVYWELSDFDLLDLRHSIGFGLRLNTPISLIRLDYGINLFRRDQEPRGVFFLSIGQSF